MALERLLIGYLFDGRYRIEEMIGRGGMGVVFRAVDERLGRGVALKAIDLGPANSDERSRLRKRFQREARAAAALPHHPNVVPVYDYGTAQELSLDYIVMELLIGEDLAARLNREGRHAVPTALDIVFQAALGLEVGHKARVIHRDIKPGNLFIEPNDRPSAVRVRVLDFGIAEITESEEYTQTHLTEGHQPPHSPAYASPEQLRGERSLTAATDVFSLGAVGFHLLTGHRAFSAAGDGKAPALQTIRSELVRAREELKEINELSPAECEVLRRALEINPLDRFRDASALVQALRALRNSNINVGRRAWREGAHTQRSQEETGGASGGPSLSEADTASDLSRLGRVDSLLTRAISLLEQGSLQLKRKSEKEDGLSPENESLRLAESAQTLAEEALQLAGNVLYGIETANTQGSRSRVNTRKTTSMLRERSLRSQISAQRILTNTLKVQSHSLLSGSDSCLGQVASLIALERWEEALHIVEEALQLAEKAISVTKQVATLSPQIPQAREAAVALHEWAVRNRDKSLGYRKLLVDKMNR